MACELYLNIAIKISGGNKTKMLMFLNPQNREG